MSPLHEALRLTITGLLDQLPAWVPSGPLEGFDEDGVPFYEGGMERGRVTSLANLKWMLEHSLENLEAWPVDKTSRWIGFVQGVLAVKSKDFHVSAERDRTRPFFHQAYQAMGLEIPKTSENS